jgi:hypothetical protein
MSAKYLIPAILVSMLAGCASTNVASATDPVRARVVADLEQARKDGSYPPSEADYVYPNWVKIANPAGVIMTDANQPIEATTTAAPAAQVAARAPAGAPVAAIMTDGHPELATVKGGGSAQ